MQPAPLTGTATTQYGQNAAADEDAARTPHGDSNSVITLPFSIFQDAARTPHGDSNVCTFNFLSRAWRMQPVPLTGTKKRETRNSSV